MDPFDAFTPGVFRHSRSRKYYHGVQVVLNPDLRIANLDGGYSRYAHMGPISALLYGRSDLILWQRKKELNGISGDEFKSNLKGFLGERVLSIMMQYALGEVVNVQQQLGAESAEIKKGVISELKKGRGRGYVCRSNGQFILKHNGPTSFVILRSNGSSPAEFYLQESYSVQTTELDGLAYLHVENQKYLLIGEASAKARFRINAWDNEHSTGTAIERVFRPLQELFPQHKLVYFVLAYPQTLFDFRHKPPMIKPKPLEIFSQLEDVGVQTVFAPIPQTSPSLDELADTIIKRELGQVKSRDSQVKSRSRKRRR
ncbi:hypothetical protein HN587_04200 [Candidatus Woesearchaeota archaeon]|jgi:hypothetical protein|nr:hypothetical protein [Candidatus Woesearchaeota archaeon]